MKLSKVIFVSLVVIMLLAGCAESPNSLGAKVLNELANGDYKINPNIMTVNNVKVEVKNVNLVRTNLNTKDYRVFGVIHNIGTSLEDVPERSIARGDKISININLNAGFEVGSTGATKLSYVGDKAVSIEKL